MRIPVGGSLKPALDLVASHAGRRLATRAIVDSGADFCLFDLDIATQLGVPLDQSAATAITGIGGQLVVCPGPLDIELRGHLLHLRVYFAPNLPINLLGRDNFFHHYIVRFDELNRELTLSSRRTTSVVH